MNAHDPFGAAKPLPKSKTKPKPAFRSPLHLDDLEICDDPIPKKRPSVSQYDPVFDKMKVGQCIKADPERVNTVAAAMRNWIRRNKRKTLAVKSLRLYPGCKEKLGRVWLIEKPKTNQPA